MTIKLSNGVVFEIYRSCLLVEKENNFIKYEKITIS